MIAHSFQVSARRELYAVLALAFQKPSEALSYARLGWMLQHAVPGTPGEEVWNGLLDEIRRWAAAPEPQWEIEGDYMALFYGPDRLASPPYESIYTGRGRQLMGRAAADVLSAYREAGFGLRDTYRDCPDHIAAEMEFMAHLCARESGAKEEGAADFAGVFREREEKFLREHLCRWVADFCLNIRRHAETAFWPIVARALQQFIEQDALFIGPHGTESEAGNCEETEH